MWEFHVQHVMAFVPQLITENSLNSSENPAAANNSDFIFYLWTSYLKYTTSQWLILENNYDFSSDTIKWQSQMFPCVRACVHVNLREAGAVLLQEEVGEVFKDWLTVQSHKLFPTDLEGMAHRKVLWIYLLEKEIMLACVCRGPLRHQWTQLPKSFPNTIATNILNTFTLVPEVQRNVCEWGGLNTNDRFDLNGRWRWGVGPWKILLNVAENLGAELLGPESLTLVEIFSLHSAVLFVIAVIEWSLHTQSFPVLHGLFSGSVPVIICHYLQQTTLVEVLFFRRGFGNQNKHKCWWRDAHFNWNRFNKDHLSAPGNWPVTLKHYFLHKSRCIITVSLCCSCLKAKVSSILLEVRAPTLPCSFLCWNASWIPEWFPHLKTKWHKSLWYLFPPGMHMHLTEKWLRMVDGPWEQRCSSRNRSGMSCCSNRNILHVSTGVLRPLLCHCEQLGV